MYFINDVNLFVQREKYTDMWIDVNHKSVTIFARTHKFRMKWMHWAFADVARICVFFFIQPTTLLLPFFPSLPCLCSNRIDCNVWMVERMEMQSVWNWRTFFFFFILPFATYAVCSSIRCRFYYFLLAKVVDITFTSINKNCANIHF